MSDVKACAPIVSAACAFMCALAAAADPSSGSDIDKGRNLAFARDKGNCLACHVIAGGTQMGDIGPPLVDMRKRFPDPERLRAQLRDPLQFNDRSLMPPFGRYAILSEQEIESIVEFLHSL